MGVCEAADVARPAVVSSESLEGRGSGEGRSRVFHDSPHSETSGLTYVRPDGRLLPMGEQNREMGHRRFSCDSVFGPVPSDHAQERDVFSARGRLPKRGLGEWSPPSDEQENGMTREDCLDSKRAMEKANAEWEQASEKRQAAMEEHSQLEAAFESKWHEEFGSKGIDEAHFGQASSRLRALFLERDPARDKVSEAAKVVGKKEEAFYEALAAYERAKEEYGGDPEPGEVG